MYKAGFIGAGNMGGALAQAVCRKIGPENVAVCRSTAAHTAEAAARLGCAGGTAAEIAEKSAFVFLGVKPGMVAEVADQINSVLPEETVLVSMLAGVRIADLEEFFGRERKIIRIMPNTPCEIGEGVIPLCAGESVTPQERIACRQLLSDAGLVDEIPEKLMDAACALSGCGPAFVCLFLEALADGGVACGLPRDKALAYAAQTVQGTAALLRQTGRHPGVLKDAVCRPGGATICGVAALEAHGLRGACMDAVAQAYEKSRRMGGGKKDSR